MIERALELVNGRYWHYRFSKKNNAPTLVLLHASPRNSAMFLPFMAHLQDHFNVVAPDTPGYGLSESLAQTPEDIYGYLPALRAFLHQIGVQKCTFYGSATGAQLGIAYALTYPNEVQKLYLDNAADFSDQARRQIVEHYFPDLTPRADGAHLLQAWAMAGQSFQFFPWFEANEAHRISDFEPTAAMQHTSAMEFLAAGVAYDLAYRFAFEHERAQKVQALTVPAVVFRWLGGMLLPHTDALIAAGLPPNVEVVEIPAATQARLTKMAEVMRAAIEPGIV